MISSECRYCGSNNHASDECPHEGYSPSTSRASESETETDYDEDGYETAPDVSGSLSTSGNNSDSTNRSKSGGCSFKGLFILGWIGLIIFSALYDKDPSKAQGVQSGARVESTSTPVGSRSDSAVFPSDNGPAFGKAPESFRVKFTTTKGTIILQIARDLSPHGVDRFYHLVRSGYFKDIAFFRVIPGFMGQFGIHGDPKVSARWLEANIQDDPVKGSNIDGSICFAKSGAPHSRTTQLFISLGNNVRLDSQGFSPFGKVEAGMDVMRRINGEYGEGAPQGRGPEQARIQAEGNSYLKRHFPNLDYIKSASIIESARLTGNPYEESTHEPRTSSEVSKIPAMEQRIREFVHAHHKKASAGDIPGLGRDYAEQVEYLGENKTNSAILKEERQYHQRWSSVTEKIVSPIISTPYGDGYIVKYTLDYRTEANGEWASGKNDLSLTVRVSGGSIRITRQSAKLYDRQSSPKTKARLKPIGLTLPKPCWIATERASNDNTLEVTDLLHLSGNRYRLHRTYRRLSADNLKVLASCRAEYEGTVQRSGDVLSIYFGQQRWGQDGDSALVRKVESNAASVIGSTLELTIQPDGMLGRGGTRPMKPVQ